MTKATFVNFFYRSYWLMLLLFPGELYRLLGASSHNQIHSLFISVDINQEQSWNLANYENLILAEHSLIKDHYFKVVAMLVQRYCYDTPDTLKNVGIQHWHDLEWTLYGTSMNNSQFLQQIATDNELIQQPSVHI